MSSLKCSLFVLLLLLLFNFLSIFYAKKLGIFCIRKVVSEFLLTEGMNVINILGLLLLLCCLYIFLPVSKKVILSLVFLLLSPTTKLKRRKLLLLLLPEIFTPIRSNGKCRVSWFTQIIFLLLLISHYPISCRYAGGGGEWI